jgi:hypothetical protein
MERTRAEIEWEMMLEEERRYKDHKLRVTGLDKIPLGVWSAPATLERKKEEDTMDNCQRNYPKWHECFRCRCEWFDKCKLSYRNVRVRKGVGKVC